MTASTAREFSTRTVIDFLAHYLEKLGSEGNRVRENRGELQVSEPNDVHHFLRTPRPAARA